MHADNCSVKAIGDFCNGEGGSVGCKDAILLADAFQLLEDFLLQLHLFQRSLYNEVAICNDFIRTSGDLRQDCIRSGLLHLALRNSLVESLCDLCLTVFCPLCLHVAELYFITFCLSKCLCDAGAHGSCADNTNFHNRNLL